MDVSTANDSSQVIELNEQQNKMVTNEVITLQLNATSSSHQ